jgi:hypothetical protein
MHHAWRFSLRGGDLARTDRAIRRQTMAMRDHDKDQELDPAGAHGGDTGKSSFKDDGPQAEKGDQRRDTPVHSGPTRSGAQGTHSQHDKRSGSESNES